MGSLKPIGSEKLQGMDKIRRMIEISNYNGHQSNPVNENESANFNRMLADGNRYEIVKEKTGYIIKKQLSEGVLEYTEPMKNRKYHSSYSQALRKLNLMAKELNSVNEHKEEISLFGEEKKFYLKKGTKEIDEQAAIPAPAPVPAPAPAPVPSPAPEEEPMPEPEMDMEEPEMDMEEPEDDGEEVTFKSIQKLTGKLAQKIRDLESKSEDEDEGMTGNDVKYVINSILSSLDLDKLEEDDVDEIMSRFEGEEEGMDTEEGDDDMDMGMEEPMPEEGMEEPAPEGEMAEMMNFGEKFEDLLGGAYASTLSKKLPGMDEMFDEGDDEMDFSSMMDDDDEYDVENDEDFGELRADGSDDFGYSDEDEEEEDFNPRGARKKIHRMNDDHLSHGTFSEAKVDSILKKYFSVEDAEKQINENKKTTFLHLRETRSEIERLSENVRQERSAIKFLDENKKAELVGITNKKNLVFQLNNQEYKISTRGSVI
jgi:hypothetical protein